MSEISVRELRSEYRRGHLDETRIDPDPYRQFAVWLEQAVKSELPHPHAMTLATADRDATPSARIVLLREHGPDEGFVFYTNYDSRKGEEIARNPRGALLFFWAELERQIRIEGSIEKISVEQSDRYFASRPRESCLSAVISQQSKQIGDRKTLEDRIAELRSELDGEPVPRPDFWGGYRVWPSRFEFWQGGENRVHDRLVYLPDNEAWTISRLQP